MGSASINNNLKDSEMYISVFKGSISTIEPSDKITLLDFLNDVQNGKHKDDVAIIRKANSEEEVKRLKKNY